MAVRNRSRIKVLYSLIFIDMDHLPSSLYCLIPVLFESQERRKEL